MGGDEQEQFDAEDAREAESCPTRAVWLRLVSKIESKFWGRNAWSGRVGLVVGGAGAGAGWALAKKPLSRTLERPLSISRPR